MILGVTHVAISVPDLKKAVIPNSKTSTGR